MDPRARPAMEADHEAAAEALALALAFASTERSRALYERNGFALTKTFHLPAGGPPLWEMWRLS